MSYIDTNDKSLWFGRKIYRYIVKSNCNNKIYQFTSTTVFPDEAIKLMDERFINSKIIYHLSCNGERIKTYGNKPSSSKKVIDTQTGEQWPSMTEFAKAKGMIPQTARYQVRKHKKRYIYE